MKIVSLSISDRKGVRKHGVEEVDLVENHGVASDAHAGDWHRQVSLLASEEIEKTRDRGLDVSYGDFAENIATTGVAWETVPIGTRVALGESALVEITQIGKECHTRCAIYYKAGDCIMPKKGVFAKVLSGGRIRRGDAIRFVGTGN